MNIVSIWEWFKRNFPNGASSAEEVISKRKSEEFRRQHEQLNYQLCDFLKDPHTLIAVMRKHIGYEGWFKRNFPNGASSKDEVLSKI